jgi:hypothetical protein
MAKSEQKKQCVFCMMCVRLHPLPPPPNFVKCQFILRLARCNKIVSCLSQLQGLGSIFIELFHFKLPQVFTSKNFLRARFDWYEELIHNLNAFRSFYIISYRY